MAWLLILVIAILILFFLKKSGTQRKIFTIKLPATSNSTASPRVEKPQAEKRVATNNWKTFYFKPPIKKGYQLLIKRLQVAGIQYRLENAFAFYHSGSEELELIPDPENPHDKHAIKIVGIHQDNKFFLGFLPKDAALLLSKTGLINCAYARLAEISVNGKHTIDIKFSIVGLKAEKKRYDDYLYNLPMSKDQKDYFAFFKLPITPKLKSGEADELIQAHEKSASEAELDEWENYNNILEYFDGDLKESDGIKKVSGKLLVDALTQLKNEGESFTELYDHIEDVVDRLIEMKPELKC